MRLNWLKYFPSFIIIGVGYFLFGSTLEGTIYSYILYVLGAIIGFIGIVYYSSLKRRSFASSMPNKIASLITFISCIMLLFAAILCLYWLFAKKDNKIMKKNPQVIDLYNTTTFYEVIGSNAPVISYTTLKNATVVLDILEIDSKNKKAKIEITVKKRDSIKKGSYIAFNNNDTNLTIKEVYYDYTIASPTIGDGEYRYYYNENYNDFGTQMKIVYEANINYVEFEGYKSFLIQIYRGSIDIPSGYDFNRYGSGRAIATEFLLYEENMPKKYTMDGYDYYLSAIILSYTALALSFVVVITKFTCFFYFEHKDKKNKDNLY